MEFESKEFGICNLIQCDYENGICLVEIKEQNRTMPFVVTSIIMRDGSWIKGEYYSNLKEAKDMYIAELTERESKKKNDCKNE